MFDFLRNLTKSEAEKRQERLSAYLDNGLTPQERIAFEEQLRSDTGLQASLEQQRQLKENISQLPRMRAPRNFTLDPAAYGRPTSQRVYTLYPVVRAATVLAAIVLIFLFSTDIYRSSSNRSVTVPQESTAAPNETSGEAGVVAEAPQLEMEPAAEEPAAEEAEESVEETAEEMSAADVGEEALAEAEAPAEAEEAVGAEAAEIPQAASAYPPEGGAAANGVSPSTSQPAVGFTGTAEADVTVDQNATITQSVTVTPSFNFAARTATPPENLDNEPYISPTQPVPETTISENQTAALTKTGRNIFLKIGLGVLFLLLLAATLLIRRQL